MRDVSGDVLGEFYMLLRRSGAVRAPGGVGEGTVRSVHKGLSVVWCLRGIDRRSPSCSTSRLPIRRRNESAAASRQRHRCGEPNWWRPCGTIFVSTSPWWDTRSRRSRHRCTTGRARTGRRCGYWRHGARRRRRTPIGKVDQSPVSRAPTRFAQQVVWKAPTRPASSVGSVMRDGRVAVPKRAVAQFG